MELMDKHNEIDMEDSDYGHFFNNLDKFGYCPEGEIDMEDPNYVHYVNNLDKFGYRPEDDHDDDDDDEDEEELEEDPEYSFFVENLKQDENGESYSVAILSSDISIVLRYEEKEEESLENVDKRRTFTRNATRKKAKVPQTLDGFSGKVRVGRPRTVKKTMEIRNDGSKKKLGDVPVQETNNGDDEILVHVPEILGSFTGKARAGRPKTVKKPLEIRVEGCKKMLRDVPCQEKKSGDNGNKRKEIDEVDPVSCKSRGDSVKMMNCIVKEESSYLFPVSLDKSGTNSEPSYKKGHTSSGTHPENDGCCSDVEVFTLDNMPSREGDYTPFVPSKCYQPLAGEEFGGGIRSSKQSQFREKLMDLLKIPYDGYEFNNLWLNVSERKPVEGVKELRGRTKLYSTTTIGRSYLDWYKELRMKIDEFKHDQHKVLCLLRGFFFWLKNIAHGDAFQPWLDKLYLKALTGHKL